MHLLVILADYVPQDMSQTPGRAHASIVLLAGHQLLTGRLAKYAVGAVCRVLIGADAFLVHLASMQKVEMLSARNVLMGISHQANGTNALDAR